MSDEILLVEDNADDEALAIRALKKNNFNNEVIVARDGAEALDFIHARGRFSERDKKILPKLVLLDLKLPKVDGLEVLKQIRANPDTAFQPVVILSTSNEETDVITSYKLGANSYIRKSVDFAQFMETIKQLGIYWLELNESPPVAGAN